MKSIDKEFYAIVGSKIKKAREYKGYSLQDLADKINSLIDISNKESGGDIKHVIRQSISKMELGKLRIDNDIYFFICHALDIDPNEVFKIKSNTPDLDNKYDNQIKTLATNNGVEISYNKSKPLTNEDFIEIQQLLLEELKDQN